jgi:hypothetical protein
LVLAWHVFTKGVDVFMSILPEDIIDFHGHPPSSWS